MTPQTTTNQQPGQEEKPNSQNVLERDDVVRFCALDTKLDDGLPNFEPVTSKLEDIGQSELKDSSSSLDFNFDTKDREKSTWTMSDYDFDPGFLEYEKSKATNEFGGALQL